MPGSNKSLYTALGVVAVLALVIGWWIWPATPELASYGETNPRNAEYRPGGKDCQSAHLATIRNRWNRESKSDACAKEAEDYRQQTDDLIQQTRAADAAKAQANIASQQLWTGWLQTLGGLLTLIAAAVAAYYAREAAYHTDIGAKAAVDGISQSKASNSIARSAYRPVISLSIGDTARYFPETADFANHQFFVDITAENVSPYPALNMFVDVHFISVIDHVTDTTFKNIANVKPLFHHRGKVLRALQVTKVEENTSFQSPVKEVIQFEENRHRDGQKPQFCVMVVAYYRGAYSDTWFYTSTVGIAVEGFPVIAGDFWLTNYGAEDYGEADAEWRDSASHEASRKR